MYECGRSATTLLILTTLFYFILWLSETEILLTQYFLSGKSRFWWANVYRNLSENTASIVLADESHKTTTQNHFLVF